MFGVFQAQLKILIVNPQTGKIRILNHYYVTT
jgi:hypothetical protein